MKFEDLQKIEALEVCEYTGNTLHLHCKQGYYLTEFIDEDYKEYTDFFCTFLPVKEEYPNYQVIDKATHTLNLEKKKEALRKRRKELEEKEELERRKQLELAQGLD